MLGWLQSAVAEGLSSGHERDQKVIISAIYRGISDSAVYLEGGQLCPVNELDDASWEKGLMPAWAAGKTHIAQFRSALRSPG